MNARSLVLALQSPSGKLVVLCLLIAFAVAVGQACKRTAQPSFTLTSKSLSTNSSIAESLSLKLSPFPSPKASNLPETPPPRPERPVSPEALPPISLFSSETPPPKEPELSSDYAPFGRLICCVSFLTVDSANLATPIVGLVTKDLWFRGRLIIPAGTEVHGRSARVEKLRERLGSESAWVFVYQTGEELPLTGMALDQEMSPDGLSWAITDGSWGLRGSLIQPDQQAELKLFLSAFLSAGTEAFQQRQTTLFGTQILPTAQNAGFAGSDAVIKVYAKRLLNSLDGSFVRVPAGKLFYVYVSQSIDRAKAKFGATRHQPAWFRDTPAATDPKVTVGAPSSTLLPSTPIQPTANNP